MSRTYKRLKRTCKCAWCIASKNRYKHIAKDLLDTGLEQACDEFHGYMFNLPEFVPVDRHNVRPWTPPAHYYSSQMSWEQYYHTVIPKKLSMHSKKALSKLQCGIGGTGSTHGA